MEFYFSIWDYDGSSNTFVSTMQTDTSLLEDRLYSWDELDSIDWVGGRRPPTDYCDFYNCETKDSSKKILLN